MTRYRIGIDIGGTFTDLVLFDERTGHLVMSKTFSTPRGLWEGVSQGLARLGVPLAETSMIFHGTTVGINAFLERKGPRIGLITTAGFRDVYEIGRHNRVEMYDLFYRKPEPLVPRELRLEVRERLDERGEVLVPLDEEDVRRAAETFRAAGVQAVAVCLLHSYVNPAHEQRVGALLAGELPGVVTSLSHEIVREWREYERTSTTAINAYILPAVGSYLDEVSARLREGGYARPLFLMESSGGVVTADVARRRPVVTLMSGPAGGVTAAGYLGRAHGIANVISFDMGGTSTDVALTYEGTSRVTTEAQVERHPVMVQMLDIRSIGAGGGSIAWLDPAGALRVGPQSAGAEPGPLCYGRGGEVPTVTDAHVVLGRLRPEGFLVGEMALDTAAARRGIERVVAQPLGLGVEAAAEGILRIVNSRMAHAIRGITVQRGLDPRGFTLMAFGGAGPMHAAWLADELSIPSVIVPPTPGTFSALGMLVADLRHNYVRTWRTSADALDGGALLALFREMAAEAEATLRGEGADPREITYGRSVDVRYVGQEYTLDVPLDDTCPGADAAAPVALVQRFHALHDRLYGHSAPDQSCEVVNVRLAAVGRRPKVTLPTLEGASGAACPTHEGSVFFHETGGWVPTGFYLRETLAAGQRLAGPAVVEEPGATTVVPPGFCMEVRSDGSLVITREER